MEELEQYERNLGKTAGKTVITGMTTKNIDESGDKEVAFCCEKKAYVDMGRTLRFSKMYEEKGESNKLERKEFFECICDNIVLKV